MKLYCNTVYRIARGGQVWLGCIVSQYKDCIARGLAGQKAVSRYKICIVTEAAGLAGRWALGWALADRAGRAGEGRARSVAIRC